MVVGIIWDPRECNIYLVYKGYTFFFWSLLPCMLERVRPAKSGVRSLKCPKRTRLDLWTTDSLEKWLKTGFVLLAGREGRVRTIHSSMMLQCANHCFVGTLKLLFLQLEVRANNKGVLWQWEHFPILAVGTIATPQSHLSSLLNASAHSVNAPVIILKAHHAMQLVPYPKFRGFITCAWGCYKLVLSNRQTLFMVSIYGNIGEPYLCVLLHSLRCHWQKRWRQKASVYLVYKFFLYCQLGGYMLPITFCKNLKNRWEVRGATKCHLSGPRSDRCK